ILQMARDVSSRSYQITQERVDELRALGLTDGTILDLVCMAALWSASARLEILLECWSSSSESLSDQPRRRIRPPGRLTPELPQTPRVDSPGPDLALGPPSTW